MNKNYLKLSGGYLFSAITKKVNVYMKVDTDRTIIRLGIGDVAQPIAPAIIKAMHEAADGMGSAAAFRGCAPNLGCAFLREEVAKQDYQARGCEIPADETSASDGAKYDCDNTQEMFAADGKIAIRDPVYPVYVDSNVVAGGTDEYDGESGTWNSVAYMPYIAENQFVPEPPKETPDLIYLYISSNPTGTTLAREQLKIQADYANRMGAVILYDATYEAYITEEDVPHSIYEIEGARICAIEFRSYSESAGFTGARPGSMVVPKDLKYGGVAVHDLQARRHGTEFNGAPYVTQRAAMTAYSQKGRARIKEQVAYYVRDAKAIYDRLKGTGYQVYGAVSSPYAWLKVPEGITSWDFLDYLLEEANVVGTSGNGFGPSGKGYFRLTGLGTYENTIMTMERMKALEEQLETT